MNHGFVDGNKRVAFAAPIIFLQINKVEPLGAEEEWIEFIYSHLEAGTFRKEVLETWLHAHTGPLP